MRLSLDNPNNYTFHSFRRSAATMAANEGASGLQMQQHFGWKNVQMAQEYISTSNVAIKDVASKLAGFGDKEEKKKAVVADEANREEKNVVDPVAKVKNKVVAAPEANGEDKNGVGSVAKGIEEIWIASQDTEKKDGISPVANDNVMEKETVVMMEEKKEGMNMEGIEAKKVFIIHGGTHHFNIH